MKRILASAAVLALCLWQAAAQDKVLKKAIELGQTDNKVMVWEDFLANTIGGRPVGSHNLEDAEKWVEKQFRSWGMDVIVQEVGQIGVGFSRGPWSGRMLSADGMNLHFTTPGYTPGTKGPQRGVAVMEPKNRAEFERVKGTLKGAWMLVSEESKGWPIALDKAVPTDSTLFYSEFAAAGVLGFVQSAKNPITTLYDRKGCFKLFHITRQSVQEGGQHGVYLFIGQAELSSEMAPDHFPFLFADHCPSCSCSISMRCRKVAEKC